MDTFVITDKISVFASGWVPQTAVVEVCITSFVSVCLSKSGKIDDRFTHFYGLKKKKNTG